MPFSRVLLILLITSLFMSQVARCNEEATTIKTSNKLRKVLSRNNCTKGRCSKNRTSSAAVEDEMMNPCAGKKTIEFGETFALPASTRKNDDAWKTELKEELRNLNQMGKNIKSEFDKYTKTRCPRSRRAAEIPKKKSKKPNTKDSNITMTKTLCDTFCGLYQVNVDRIRLYELELARVDTANFLGSLEKLRTKLLSANCEVYNVLVKNATSLQRPCQKCNRPIKARRFKESSDSPRTDECKHSSQIMDNMSKKLNQLVKRFNKLTRRA